MCDVMHLFDTSLPCSVYKKRTDGAGRNTLHFTRFEMALSKHKTSIDRLDMTVGSICSHLNMPTPAALNRGCGARGVGAAAGVDVIE